MFNLFNVSLEHSPSSSLSISADTLNGAEVRVPHSDSWLRVWDTTHNLNSRLGEGAITHAGTMTANGKSSFYINCRNSLLHATLVGGMEDSDECSTISSVRKPKKSKLTSFEFANSHPDPKFTCAGAQEMERLSGKPLVDAYSKRSATLIEKVRIPVAIDATHILK